MTKSDPLPDVKALPAAVAVPGAADTRDFDARPQSSPPPTEEDDAEFRSELLSMMSMIRGYSRSLCRDYDLADDLVQDALCRAWAARSQFRRGTNLKAWLVTILRNEYRSYRRWAWRCQPWDEEVAQNTLTTEGSQIWALELSDATRGLSALSPEQREALLLLKLAGYAYSEIAPRYRCREGTLKSRVSRGRISLAALLDGSSRTKFVGPRSSNRSAHDAIMSELDSLMLAHKNGHATEPDECRAP